MPPAGPDAAHAPGPADDAVPADRNGPTDGTDAVEAADAAGPADRNRSTGGADATDPADAPGPPDRDGSTTEADGAAPADSAGVPWRGRRFEPNVHAADDGSADPALLAALTAPRGSAAGQVAIVEAFRTARLLIPLVAELGDEPGGGGGSTGSGTGPGGDGPHAAGLRVDKTQELSIVSVAAPDGRRVLPVFTSVAAMARWDATARPVPADGRRVALAAASDDTDLVVVDPGSGTEFVLRRPAVWAIGQTQPWEPAFASAEVFAGLAASIGTELAVLDLTVEAGDPTGRLRGPELVVRLQLSAGLEPDELDAVTARLAARWAADDRVAVLVDSLAVALVRAG